MPTDTPSPPTTPEAVLLAAADYIEQHGWWNGQGTTPDADDATACVIGAVHRVCDVLRKRDVALDRFRSHIGKWCIVDWNDAQPDGATVVAALRRAAGGA